MVDLPHTRAFMRAYWAIGPMLASLAMAVLCMLPRLTWLCLPKVQWRLAPLFAQLKDRMCQTCAMRWRAPTGVLLVGVLSNAGGLAFSHR